MSWSRCSYDIMVAGEFQAVVLAAGHGSRMTEVTAGRPKCLLPIANMPMIWYPLRMLEREGFQDAIVIVADNTKSEIQAALEKCNLSIRLDYAALPPGKEDWGTADSLQFINEKIKSDVVVVSSDFITDASLYPALELFRKNEAAVTMFFLKPAEVSAGDSLPTPGPKTKHKPERDLVGINADTSRLVLLASVSDFDETLPLSRGLLRKHPHLQLYSRLLDSHVYILRKWVCEFLVQERSLGTLKGELLPYIVRKQSSKPTQKVEDASTIRGNTKNDIFQFAKESTLVSKVLPISLSNDHWGDMKGTFQDDKIRCYAHIVEGTSFGMRVNTLQAYASINREILQIWEKVTGGNVLVRLHPGAEVKSTQVDDSTLVGEGTLLNEKTSFKSSTIGASCTVMSRTRISNCVIMNNVKVNEGCVLTNCILCDGVEVGANTELKDCLVGAKHTVGAGDKHNQEFLADEDVLMEI
ncbi:translation initiation factor eIF-2B subunit gamma isoform X2 [Thrips palmi]|uniref:Translation initiation factor eIF2B subunit gamma n=1 Tax=Thrips palmi TaxID=161013 RepID=A0A6P8ZMM3_THRPL|nr:translation initiation factor eIF-2B subunit gamma isoform X2 [Thrips palmi]